MAPSAERIAFGEQETDLFCSCFPFTIYLSLAFTLCAMLYLSCPRRRMRLASFNDGRPGSFLAHYRYSRSIADDKDSILAISGYLLANRDANLDG
jgi:hypothetical protein